MQNCNVPSFFSAKTTGAADSIFSGSTTPAVTIYGSLGVYSLLWRVRRGTVAANHRTELDPVEEGIGTVEYLDAVVRFVYARSALFHMFSYWDRN